LLDWYIREVLQSEVKDIVADPLQDKNFPPDFDFDQHMEPVGKYFQWYKLWDKILQDIKRLM
jgi:hypothetical protein